MEGQIHLSDDVDSCDDDDRLRQLAKHLDTALLRPMVALSSRPGVEDSTEDSATRRACQQRDKNQCVVTNFWNPDCDSRPPGALTAYLEAVPIISFGNFRKVELYQQAQVWNCLYRYFPTIRGFFHDSNEDDNRYDNVMMLAEPLHQDFRRFSIILEETDVSDRYRVKTFPNFENPFLWPHIPEFLVLTSHDPQYPVPNKFLLGLHAAIGNILHATGHSELIEKTLKHLGGSGGRALAEDGSTNVEELLSVTRLSLLANDIKRWTVN
jgi:hypothetical protein